MEVIKKILLNTLTLLRIPLTILFVILFITNNKISASLILFLIVITDFIDGKISRKLNINSRLGSILDAYCDLFFVLCTTLLFNYYNLVSVTYTFIIILKFLEFNITSYYSGMSNNKTPFIFDKVGRIITALYQGVPFIIVIPSLSDFCYLYTTILIIGTFISSALRIFSLLCSKVLNNKINKCLLINSIKSDAINNSKNDKKGEECTTS